MFSSFQGQCSAGTLPVAWVDEGPGPPRCPQQCKHNLNILKTMEENRLNDKQQCLHYLGDRTETSPEHICKNLDKVVTTLSSIRLRHCCERSALSALHNDAFRDVQNSSSLCIKTLKDLMETDSLAARITCEFTEILIRYDCRQSYSIIHHCEDCKVSPF